MGKKLVNGEWIEYGQEVTLTGSNVILYEGNHTVTAGAYFNINHTENYVEGNSDELVTNTSAIYGSISNTDGVSHDFTLTLARKYKGRFLSTSVSVSVTGGQYGSTGQFDVYSPSHRATIHNKDLVSRSYLVVIGGVN